MVDHSRSSSVLESTEDRIEIKHEIPEEREAPTQRTYQFVRKKRSYAEINVPSALEVLETSERRVMEYKKTLYKKEYEPTSLKK